MTRTDYIEDIQDFIAEYIKDNIEAYLFVFAGYNPMKVIENNLLLQADLQFCFYNNLKNSNLGYCESSEILTVEPNLLLDALKVYNIVLLEYTNIPDSLCDRIIRKFLFTKCFLNVCEDLVRDISSDIEYILDGNELRGNATSEIIANYICKNGVD